MDGYGRVLYYAKDVWPNYISCCLVVHEDLIRDKPEVVRDLVRGIVASGEWAQKNRTGAAKLVAPYFGQNEKLMNYVLTQPPDRVTFINLKPTDVEMQKIMDMGISLGFLKVRDAHGRAAGPIVHSRLHRARDDRPDAHGGDHQARGQSRESASVAP